jgi:hypothetical protein
MDRLDPILFGSLLFIFINSLLSSSALSLENLLKLVASLFGVAGRNSDACCEMKDKESSGNIDCARQSDCGPNS